MIGSLKMILLCSGALGCAVISGVYFTFSAFVMTALGSIDRAAGVSAMQAINSAVLNSLFMPLFWGTTLVSVVAGAIALMAWSDPASKLVFAASSTLVIGMFLVTVLANVPMNGLMAVSPQSGEAMPIWVTYLSRWTWWNNIRTVASIVASALYLYTLVTGWPTHR